jgi:hypothetical protein
MDAHRTTGVDTPRSESAERSFRHHCLSPAPSGKTGTRAIAIVAITAGMCTVIMVANPTRLIKLTRQPARVPLPRPMQLHRIKAHLHAMSLGIV